MLVLGVALGCDRDPMKPSVASGAALEPGVIATVADNRIFAGTLDRVLERANREPRPVLHKLIELKMLAHFAEHGGLEVGRLHATTRAVLARALLERIEAATRMPELPSDEELSAATERRWIDVDRPEAREVCHAVVSSKALDTAAGEALGRQLADALRPYRECKSFIEAAQKVPVAGTKIIAEPLPPVTPDGRTLVLNESRVPVDEGTPLDKEFTRAVFAIKATGEQSPLVRTPFGWHVILFSSRVEPKHVPKEERRRMFVSDVLQARARREADRLISERQRGSSVVVDRAAVETMERVQVGQ
jgi:hypothetical protein